MATETVNITTTLADDSVTNAKLANMNEATFKARRVSIGSGDPQDVNAERASEILDTAPNPFVRTSVLPTVVTEDPGPGVGMIESGAGVSPIVLKNLKNGAGTKVTNNTGSVQVDIDFTVADRYYYSDGTAEPVEGTITSAGRDLLDDANAAAQRTTLGLGTAATANTGDFDAAGAAAAAQAASQPLDSDLTAIAGLSPSNDDVIQRKAGAWTNRSLAQLLSDFLFTTIGLAYGRLTNPGAVTFPRQNADNTVTSRTAEELRSDISVLGLITKPTDEGRTTTTLAADSTLVLPMLANTNYTGQITFYVSASAAGDFKSRITGPAGGTVKFLGQFFAASGGTPSNRVAQAYDSSDLNQAYTSDFVTRGVIYFSIANGVNAGNLELTWAQVAASGTTTVLAGSTIEWSTY